MTTGRTASKRAGAWCGTLRAACPRRPPSGLSRRPARHGAKRRCEAVPDLGVAGTQSTAVLLTREASKNDKLRDILEARGIETFELPLLEHTRDEGGRGGLVSELSDPAGKWFLTTSPEAAGVFADCWRAAGCPDLSLASIGRGTTRSLEENGAGGLIRFTPTKATGKVMAAELPLASDGTNEIVVYPSSALASNDIEGGLTARGFHVKRINTYSTQPVGALTPDQETAAQRARIVTFGSPSAIKAWIKLTDRKDVFCCCIGGTSHDACVRLGFDTSRVLSPANPGLVGWADVVEQAMERVATE